MGSHSGSTTGLSEFGSLSLNFGKGIRKKRVITTIKLHTHTYTDMHVGSCRCVYTWFVLMLTHTHAYTYMALNIVHDPLVINQNSILFFLSASLKKLSILGTH